MINTNKNHVASMKDLDLNDGLPKKDHPQDSTPRTNKK